MSYRERAVWAGMLAVAFATAFALFIRRNPFPANLNDSPLNSKPKSSPFVLDHELIDLTHPLSPNMPVFPGGENFRTTKLSDWQRGYYLNKFSMGEHCGTHIDAPLHFESQGKGVDELPILDLFGPAVVIDCESQCASNADFELQLEDVRRWENKNELIPTRSFVIARTGWWKRWTKPDEYINVDQKGQPHFPGYSLAAIQYLLDERKVLGIGIDTLSVDPGSSRRFPVHHAMAKAGCINIENLSSGLDRLPEIGGTLIVAPLPISRGSGAPARVFALIPKSAR